MIGSEYFVNVTIFALSDNFIYHRFIAPQVITSKQRPRKLTIVGGDGRKYMFLLKGHEDLRQDERVMQFFRDRFNRKIAASLVLALTFEDCLTFSLRVLNEMN